MLQPNIAKCYDEIVEDPFLLQLSLEKECTSLWELPLLGAFQFRLISERLFAHIASPDMWGKTGVEFITWYWPDDQQGGHCYGDPNYRWGRGRKLGYGDHLLPPWSSQNGGFCHALSALHQSNSLRPKCGGGEKIHQHSIYSSSNVPFPLSGCGHSLQGTSSPNSHWTGSIYMGYSPSLGLRCSYIMKRGRWSWKCTTFPERFCERVQKKNTASQTQFCWSAHQPFIHI